MQEIILLPCPCCGSKATKSIKTIGEIGDYNYEIAIIKCDNDNCGVQIQDADTPRSHFIEHKWNCRLIKSNRSPT